jgi:hypothetical protein
LHILCAFATLRERIGQFDLAGIEESVLPCRSSAGSALQYSKQSFQSRFNQGRHASLRLHAQGRYQKHEQVNDKLKTAGSAKWK